jgi:hypothetical protein
MMLKPTPELEAVRSAIAAAVAATPTGQRKAVTAVVIETLYSALHAVWQGRDPASAYPRPRHVSMHNIGDQVVGTLVELPEELRESGYRAVMTDSDEILTFAVTATELREKVWSLRPGVHIDVTLVWSAPGKKKQYAVIVDGVAS